MTLAATFPDPCDWPQGLGVLFVGFARSGGGNRLHAWAYGRSWPRTAREEGRAFSVLPLCHVAGHFGGQSIEAWIGDRTDAEQRAMRPTCALCERRLDAFGDDGRRDLELPEDGGA